MTEKIEVEVGQIWQDCDKRQTGRYAKVLSIQGGLAKCLRVKWGESGWVPATERATYVSVSRMRPTASGYKLVGPIEEAKV